MAAPNAVEVGLISEFRKRFQNGELNEDQSTDVFLIRWIRARNQNLDKAEEFLRKSLKWRQENGIDNILSWEPSKELKEMVPVTFLGYDAENSPVHISHLGRYKLKQLVQSGQTKDAMKFLDWIYEQTQLKMKGKTQKDGTPVSQHVLIVDIKGFKFKSLGSKGVADLLCGMSRALEANYPETVKTLYCVNTGRLFPVLLALSKPVLAPATIAKLSIVNSPSKWRPVLLQKLPAEILPPYYGGTNTTTELACDAEADDADDESEIEFVSVTLPKGDKYTVAFEVEEKNSTIHWAFKTKEKEISFAVHFAANGTEKIFVQEAKFDSHVKLVEGSKVCDSTGEYTFSFGNAADAQELEYRIDIRSASGAKQLSFD